MNINW